MFKRKRVNVAALIAIGAASLPVWAQDAQPQQLERIEVTGSRIKTVNTETVSPVVSLSAEAIKIEARRDVEGLLNNLPQVFADQGGEVSNGSTGTATVNLRGLGASRTLVLVNGRRLPAGSPRSLPADLNQIPVSLIKRVEVLTGGASGVYGSDAVAGVVNFIVNDRFEGVDLDLNYQFYNHQQHQDDIASIIAGRAATNPTAFAVPGNKDSDGKTRDFALTIGSNLAGNKGNATLFVSHKVTDALAESERDFSACALNYNAAKGAWTCGGSGTSYPGRFLNQDTGKSFTVADANGGVRPWVAATDQYNFAPTNYFQRPSDRTTAAAYIHYDVNDMAKLYTELNFHDDHTVAQIAPSGLFGLDLSGPNAVKFENPLLSQAWKTTLGLNKPGDTANLLIFRRNVEGGGRQDDIRHTSYRGVIGVKGDLNNAFGYDAFVQIGRVVYQETYLNDFSNRRSQLAMDVVTDPASGNPVCRATLNGTDSSCVPYNIWALGKVTPGSLAYASTPGFQKGFTSQAVTGFNINGDLTDYGVKVPLASSGLAFAAGLERRTERMRLDTDAEFTTGDLAGQGGPTIGVAGKYDVNEFFGELRLPVIEKKPFAEALNLSASYRRSSYSTGPVANTYGLGLDYKPVQAIGFRGSYQKATRAANIVELFSTQSLGLYDNDADPCAGANVGGKAQGGTGATLAQCQNTGVTAAQFGNIVDSPAGQYNQIGGGNPALKPEQSKSVTFGVVLTPVRDLSVTADYFNIKVTDTISSFAAPVVLQQCLDTGNPVFCSLIHRDGLGTLWATPQAYTTVLNQNIGRLQTSGVDVGADYGLKLTGYGKIDFSFLGTYLTKLETEDIPGLPSYDCVGYFGNTCGTPNPKWRHRLRTTWTTPWALQFAATWRHMDKVQLDAASSQSRLTGSTASQVPFLGARDYLDLAVAYNLNKAVTMRLAVNNLLDRDPPIRTQGSGLTNGNTYPTVYDSMGRRVSLNVNFRF